MIDSLSDVCLDILAQSASFLNLTPDSASHFRQITSNNSVILQLKLLKSILIVPSPTKAVGRESRIEFTIKDRLLYNREAIKMLEKARSVLPQDTVRLETNLLGDNLRALEIQSDCVSVVTVYLYFKLLHALGQRNLPPCFESLDKFQRLSEFEVREFLREQAALKNDDATKTFLLDWQRLCFVPLDLEPLTERIIEPYFLYELSVLKELKSSSDANRFRTATDRILQSLDMLFEEGFKERMSASYLSTSDSSQYPVSAILFLDNVLAYAGQLSAKLNWDEIIFKLEILCEAFSPGNNSGFEDKGVVYNSFSNKANIENDYF